ncbi:MAG: YlmC/YmxH family sporulation protein, partial [Clostridia bacterium]|nr:YlmC/YmxH family sporulation protein [Clostridia bacterium]
MKMCRLVDLCDKEVINIKTGNSLGCVCDVEFDMNCAKLTAIIIYGKPKCFGILGRRDDIIIKWCDIDIIGEDTILVCKNHTCAPL